MLTQDSMGLILREVEIIIMEKMHFMKDTPRVQASNLTCTCTYTNCYGCLQIVWLTKELVASNAADAERLCFALLKQTPCEFYPEIFVHLHIPCMGKFLKGENCN